MGLATLLQTTVQLGISAESHKHKGVSVAAEMGRPTRRRQSDCIVLWRGHGAWRRQTPSSSSRDEMKHFQKISAWFRTKTAGETGASLVEYSLLIALIAVVALVAIRFFGGELSTSYSDIAQSVSDN